MQILLYPQNNLSPVLCHAPVSRAWWTSSTGHVTVTRAVPRQWWSTWPEGHSRGMAPVVATSKGQSRPPGRRPLLAYSYPSPSSHGSEMVKSDRRGLILTKPKKCRMCRMRGESLVCLVGTCGVWLLATLVKFVQARWRQAQTSEFRLQIPDGQMTNDVLSLFRCRFFVAFHVVIFCRY